MMFYLRLLVNDDFRFRGLGVLSIEASVNLSNWTCSYYSSIYN